jgi:hypothetical protein
VLLPLLPTWAQPANDDPPPLPPTSPGVALDAGVPARAAAKNAVPTAQGAVEFLRKGLFAGPTQAAEQERQAADQAANNARARREARSLADQIEAAQDEVELQEAQLQVKQAQLQASMTDLQRAKSRLERLHKLARNNAVSHEQVEEANAEVISLESQIAIKRAELREPEVRLKQAHRRLANLKNQAALDQRPAQSARTRAAGLFNYVDVDLGTVPRGQQTSYRFVMTNNTRETFHIAAVRVSAGFLTAKPEQILLEPGEAGDFQVLIDTSRFSGPRTAMILVQFDRPQSETVELRVSINSAEGAATKLDLTRGPAREQGQKRLADLEKKLDALTKEIESLRKELRRPQLVLPPNQQPLLPPNSNGFPEFPQEYNVVPIVPGNNLNVVPRVPEKKYQDPRNVPAVPLAPPPENRTPGR